MSNSTNLVLLKSELEKWQLKATIANLQFQLIPYQGREANDNIERLTLAIQQTEGAHTNEPDSLQG
jgi:hypothetical protein